jgi:membrane-bound ClpP family serine protease
MRYLSLLTELAKSRRKKRRPSLPKLSSLAVVNTDLTPKGSVLAGGELWNAESVRGDRIETHTSVQVVGFRDHLLLVQDKS